MSIGDHKHLWMRGVVGPDGPEYLTVHTDAGDVTIGSQLVDVRDGKPVVMVQVEHNTSGHARTSADGDWSMETTRLHSRLDVRLKREGD